MTSFCLPCASDPYLLAVLNSPLMWRYLTRVTLHGKDEALRLKTDKMERIPIARPTEAIRAIESIVPQLQSLYLETSLKLIPLYLLGSCIPDWM